MDDLLTVRGMNKAQNVCSVLATSIHLHLKRKKNMVLDAQYLIHHNSRSKFLIMGVSISGIMMFFVE